MIRRWTLVCVGLLLLALSWDGDAPTALAQSGSGVEAAEINDPSLGRVSAAINRRLYYLGGIDGSPQVVTPPVPGSARIIACHTNGSDGHAVLENGEVWVYAPQTFGTSWHLSATFPVGSTAASQETFGSIKARYR